MARNLTTSVKTEIAASLNRPFLLFEGEFSTFTLRLWTGSYDLSWDSKTWLGNGWFTTISSIEESNDLSANGIDITLSGVPQAMISTILDQVKQNAPGRVWLGFLDASGSVIADPYLAFSGKLDVPTIDDQVDGPVISISYESIMIDFDKEREYRYTPESQKLFNVNDKGFEYVAQIAKGYKGQWGPTQKQIKKREERNKVKRSHK